MGQIKLLEKKDFKKSTHGPRDTFTHEGKGKAQSDSGLSLVSTEKVNDMDLRSMGLGKDNLEGVGRFTYGILKAKSNSNLVKGKKDFARSRASHINSTQSGRTQENKSSNTQWTPSIATLQAGKSGGFTFGDNPRNEMGELCKRQNCDDPTNGHNRDKSSTHPHHRVVQSESQAGLEVGFLTDNDKLKAGFSTPNRPGLGKNGRTMMEVFVKHTGARGGKNNCLESYSSNIGKSSAV